jgi:hypothetical protein
MRSQEEFPGCYLPGEEERTLLSIVEVANSTERQSFCLQTVGSQDRVKFTDIQIHVHSAHFVQNRQLPLNMNNRLLNLMNSLKTGISL